MEWQVSWNLWIVIISYTQLNWKFINSKSNFHKLSGYIASDYSDSYSIQDDTEHKYNQSITIITHTVSSNHTEKSNYLQWILRDYIHNIPVSDIIHESVEVALQMTRPSGQEQVGFL